MMRKMSSGVTLTELLVSTTLFMALMGSVFGVFISVLRTYQEKLRDAPTFRQASVALERISREIREDAVQVIYPRRNVLLSDSGTSLLVLDVLGEGKKERIGFSLDKGMILETRYDPTKGFQNREELEPLEEPGNPRILGKGIMSLTFQEDRRGLLMIQLCVEKQKKPVWLRTKTRWGVGL
ncbi:MAG: hypothetical protein HYU64_17605 [Armatimonadetes bacterium]|nr:hypothetical protein [Armatimonadota bacterium]